MTIRAYFMVNVVERFCQKGFQDVLRELEAIPDVKSVERVGGVCDLFVEVDAPLSRLIFVANKIMANEWVKNLRILQVEPFQTEQYQGLTLDELVRLKRVIPTEVA